MAQVMIRSLRVEDYDALTWLWEEAELPYRPEGRDARTAIARQLAKETAIYLVAEAEGYLVGAVLGTHDGRKGWINRLAVHPRHRRRGLARRLVAEVERRFTALGIEIVAALVEGWNDESREVFQRLGYERHPDMTYFSKRKGPHV